MRIIWDSNHDRCEKCGKRVKGNIKKQVLCFNCQKKKKEDNDPYDYEKRKWF